MRSPGPAGKRRGTRGKNSLHATISNFEQGESITNSGLGVRGIWLSGNAPQLFLWVRSVVAGLEKREAQAVHFQQQHVLT